MTIDERLIHNNENPCFRVAQNTPRYSAVTTTTTRNEVDFTGADADQFLGVTTEEREEGQMANINIETFFLGIAETLLTVGMYVKTTATGTFEEATSGEHAVAIVLREATVVGEIVEFRRIPTIVLP